MGIGTTVNLCAIQTKGDVFFVPFNRILMELVEARFLHQHQRLPIAAAAITQAFNRTGGIVIGSAITMMFKNIDFAGTGHRPAHGLICLINRRFIVLSAQ